ncbi:16S rRNA (cytosine(967)-C(5))-methyltransferase RsmB [[Haemophilus] felis]|nr:16S rRNA (cytosine(967)-C(5))-methyltransferase RsmB [[Haemophilus] felis]
MKNNQRLKSTKPMLSVRAVAAQIILQVLHEGKSLSSLIPEYQQQIREQDSALLQEICFGVCRVLPRLESIISILLDKPLKGKTRIVHCLLLVGMYQLLYTRIPSHAAVDEVVSATKQLKLDSFRGLTNAVLRRFLREQETILATVDKHWQTLHPEWFVNRLKKAYPNWREIIDANNQKPPMWLRINPQKTSATEYKTLLQNSGIDLIIENEENPCAICLTQGKAVSQLPHFSEGWVTVQDLHAQWAALLLGAKDQEVILDACAAPGGKTTHILELAPAAKVVALDVEENRLKRVKENLQRLQQEAIVICGDATQPEQWLNKVQKELGQGVKQFDRILLDAPCSATGVIRRHPDIKWLRQDSDIENLVQLQQQILQTLWQYLKPNGTLLYATCSVLPEENSYQIQQFLAHNSDAYLEKLPFMKMEEQEQVGYQFFPSQTSGDGFYYAKLTKKS